MRKLFKLPLFAMSLFAVALATVSCDDPITGGGTGGGGNPDDSSHLTTAEDATHLYEDGKVYLYGDVRFYEVNHDASNVELAEVILTNETLVSADAQNYEGKGEGLKLALLANVSEDGVVKLHTGTYNVGTYNEKTPQKGGVLIEAIEGTANVYFPGYVGSCFFSITGEASSERLTVIGKNSQAKVVVTEKDGIYTISAKLADNTTFYFSGTIKEDKSMVYTVEGLYKDEPARIAEGLNIKFTEVYLTHKTNVLGSFDDVILDMQRSDDDDNVTAQAHLYMSAPSGTSKCYGKDYFLNYNRSGDHVGVGYDAQAGSMTTMGDGTYTTVGSSLKIGDKNYYFASGTVTISDGKMVSFEAVSGRGTIIIGTSSDTYL